MSSSSSEKRHTRKMEWDLSCSVSESIRLVKNATDKHTVNSVLTAELLRGSWFLSEINDDSFKVWTKEDAHYLVPTVAVKGKLLQRGDQSHLSAEVKIIPLLTIIPFGHKGFVAAMFLSLVITIPLFSLSLFIHELSEFRILLPVVILSATLLFGYFLYRTSMHALDDLGVFVSKLFAQYRQ